MKNNLPFLLFPLFFILFSCSDNQNQGIETSNNIPDSNWDGRYFAFEMMCWKNDSTGKVTCFRDSLAYDGDKQEVWKGGSDSTNWYYRKKLLIRGDSVFMDVSHRFIVGKDTFSSEGSGLDYYRGKLISKGNFKQAELLKIGCDLCGVPMVYNPKTNLYDQEIETIELKIEKKADGLLVNDLPFKPDRKDTLRLVSEYMKYERILNKKM